MSDYDYGEVEAKYKKKTSKRTPKKANHKHLYQNVIIEYRYPRNYPVQNLAGKPTQALESYCTVCGKLSSAKYDSEAQNLFPKISNGFFGFLVARLSDDDSEEKKYWAYCNKKYPHIFIEDYDSVMWKNQVFINLDDLYYIEE